MSDKEKASGAPTPEASTDSTNTPARSVATIRVNSVGRRRRASKELDKLCGIERIYQPEPQPMFKQYGVWVA